MLIFFIQATTCFSPIDLLSLASMDFAHHFSSGGVSGKDSLRVVQEIGTLLKWHTDKGFGFIKRDSGAPNVFCHASQLRAEDVSINEGDRLLFVVEMDQCKGKERATHVRLAPVRGKCKYGGACYRENPEHHIQFAHPGDPDWDQSVELSKTAASRGIPASTSTPTRSVVSKSTAATLVPPVVLVETPILARPPCRYGKDCYRQSKEHRSEFAHPGDDDWAKASAVATSAAKEEADKQESIICAAPVSAQTVRLSSRPSCQWGKDCLTQGREHRRAFAHPGDDDWLTAAGVPMQDRHEIMKPRSARSHQDNDTVVEDTHKGAATDAHQFIIAPTWLPFMTSAQLCDLSSDLDYMACKFNLEKAMLTETGRTKQIEVAAKDVCALDQAKQELCSAEGLLEYYCLKSQASDNSCVEQDYLPLPAASEEMRIHPENGQAFTLNQLIQLYQERYSPSEIKDYWHIMQLS